jgi:hypothetical protein
MIVIPIEVDTVEFDIPDAESKPYGSRLWMRRAEQRRVRLRKRGEELEHIMICPVAIGEWSRADKREVVDVNINGRSGLSMPVIRRARLG